MGLIKPASGGGDVVRLAEVQLAANASVIQFTNIPQDYRHLLFTGRVRTNSTTEVLGFRCNGDTTGAYEQTWTRNGVAQTDSAQTGGLFAGFLSTAWGAFEAKLLAYRDGETKVVRFAGGMPGGETANGISEWNNAAAVTSVDVGILSGNHLAAGSRITLYGLR